MSKNDTQFGKSLVQLFGSKILESHLNLILICKTQFVSNKTLAFAIKFIKNSVNNTELFEVLVPYFERLLYENAIPMLLFS